MEEFESEKKRTPCWIARALGGKISPVQSKRESQNSFKAYFQRINIGQLYG